MGVLICRLPRSFPPNVAAARARATRRSKAWPHGDAYGDEGPRGCCPGERACGGGVDGPRQAHRFRRHGGDLGPKGCHGLWHDQSDAGGARCERGALPAFVSPRSNVAMPTSQAISPRRSRARSSSRRSRGTSSRRSAHPRLLTGAPVRSSSAPKLSLSPRHRPHPGSPAIASILAVGPAPVPACAWSCLSSLGTFVADGAVLLLQAALHESPGHASRVQD